MICKKAVKALLKQDELEEERIYFSKGICPSCGHTCRLRDMMVIEGYTDGNFIYRCPKCKYELPN